MFAKLEAIFHPNRIFSFLVAYRWAALIPALWMLIESGGKPQPQQWFQPAAVYVIALGVNFFITLFNHRLNQLVLEHPLLLGVDLIFCAGLLIVSGGSHSPYYLFALSPLLAGSFFFQVRGAFIMAAIFTPLYLLSDISSLESARLSSESATLLTQLAGIWLIPILFAYLSALLKVINQARDELSAARDELAEKHENLANAHRQLEIIHDLALLLQAAPDLLSVQERVLGAVTTDLGFSKAVVALVDPALEELGGWTVHPADDSFPFPQPVQLKPENGRIIKAILTRSTLIAQDDLFVGYSQLNDWFKQSQWFILPLYLREHPVGVLLVEESDLTKERESALATVANQAALTLGTTILCIDRARRLAVETERNRIARDIHDTVAQSLFGIVYSLDACINMLPTKAEDVKRELTDLRALANSAHEGVRRSIFDLWPSSLTIEVFMADLTNYINSYCRPRSFSIIFNHHGDFNSLPSGSRRAIYRMAQETLANSARHSGANSARLCLNVTRDKVFLDVSDTGKGFDPQVALSRSVNREHFGLHGIQERVHAMGGDFEIFSQPDEGARILITLPIKEQYYA